MQRDRSEIAREVEREAREIFNQERWLPKEITLGKFGALGTTLGYDVAAHGKGSRYGEWLYDLSWFETSGDNYFTCQPLVLESEERPDQRLDGDFHKLVQARADVHVWIAKVHSMQTVQDHVANCKEQIKRFVGTLPEDIYIFVIYDRQGMATFFERFNASTIL